MAHKGQHLRLLNIVLFKIADLLFVSDITRNYDNLLFRLVENGQLYNDFVARSR